MRIGISIKVGDGASGFETTALANSIERAVPTARSRYPGSEIRVLFPTGPGTFFATGHRYEGGTGSA